MTDRNASPVLGNRAFTITLEWARATFETDAETLAFAIPCAALGFVLLVVEVLS